MLWVVNQWWIRTILRFFDVNFLYPKFAVHHRSKQLMPVIVKFRLGVLVCGLQGHLLSHLSVLAQCFHATKTTEAMKTCGVWVLSNSDLEAGLPAIQLPMFTKCDALPKRDLCDMLICLRNPFPPNSRHLFFAKTFNSWRDQRVGRGELLSRESQSSSNNVRVDVWVVNQWWIRMIFPLKYSVPKICCHRSIQATHGILMPVTVKFRIDFFGSWSPRRFVVASFDVGPMFPCNKSHEAMKNCPDWVFSHGGFEVWLPDAASLSAALVRKMWRAAEKRFVRHVCLRNPCLLWNLSLHFLPEAWDPWERQHTSPSLHYGCIVIVFAKDRLVVSKVCTTGYWLWSRLSYRCDCCTSMKNCRDWVFSLRGLEVRLPAFQLPMFATCDAAPNKICETCLFQESIPAIPFWNFKHPLPTRSLRFLRAACSTSSALCLHHAHPFVAAEGKNLSDAEKQRVWSRSCGLEDLLQYTDCGPMWVLQRGGQPFCCPC